MNVRLDWIDSSLIVEMKRCSHYLRMIALKHCGPSHCNIIIKFLPYEGVGLSYEKRFFCSKWKMVSLKFKAIFALKT